MVEYEMKTHRNYFALGTAIKYLTITLAVFFAFVIFSHIADTAFERSVRFDCWKLEQYATTYEAFWITENESEACRSLGIEVNAEIRK